MSVARGAVLNIGVEQENGRPVLRLRRNRADGSVGDGVSAPVSCTFAIVADIRKEMQNLLLAFKNELKTAKTPKKTYDALVFMFCEGRRLVRRIFDGQTPKVLEEFQQALPFWRVFQQSPPLVEVRGQPEDLLPIDFLPLLDFTNPPSYERPDNLTDLAARFLGFSAMLMQSDLTKDKPTDIGRKSPNLPLKFFRHADLKGAETERRFFESHNPRIVLDGPWPDSKATSAQSPTTLRNMLAQNLWDPAVRFGGELQDPPFQIHHFACHCNTSDRNSLQHQIALKGNRHNEFKASLRHLYDSFGDMTRNAPEPTRPLVFLNACGSAVVVPTGSVSFPGFFVKNSFVGFIGTETPIPDEWAARFSKRFYELLLEGNSVGEAVYFAKWSLMKQRDLCGMFYVLYANPFLQLVPRGVH